MMTITAGKVLWSYESDKSDKWPTHIWIKWWQSLQAKSYGVMMGDHGIGANHGDKALQVFWLANLRQAEEKLKISKMIYRRLVWLWLHRPSLQTTPILLLLRYLNFLLLYFVSRWLTNLLWFAFGHINQFIYSFPFWSLSLSLVLHLAQPFLSCCWWLPISLF